MLETTIRPTLIASIFYQDPMSALEWLERAFGFERTMLITTKDGVLAHSEMQFGGALIFVGGEYAEFIASPAALGGKTTQSVHISIPSGLEAHCERARAAGAAIMREPTDEFYGDRVYTARDCEGHLWSFAQTVKAVSREEAEAASGLTIDGWI